MHVATSQRQLLPLLLMIWLSLASTFTVREKRVRRRDETDINQGMEDADGRRLVEGDIVLGSDELSREPPQGESPTLSATRLWPNALVIYDYQEGLANQTRLTIEAAIQMWNNYTCLKFIRKRLSDSNYILFVASMGCWSYLGFQGGEQKISVGRGCRQIGVVAHQIGHAIGFGHEALRSDRDRYIRIMKKNINQSDFVQYFSKHSSGLRRDRSNILDIEYDFESIMHFKNTSYSRGRRKLSIKVKRHWRNEVGNLGQRERLSLLDIKRANLLYTCPTDVGECADGMDDCSQVCVPQSSSLGGYRCSCYKGFYLEPNEKDCKKIDYCKKLKCSHSCRMDGSKAICTCQSGYGLKYDKKTCKDLDECSYVRHSPCRQDQVCKNSQGSYSCVCRKGYVERNGACEDIDECALKSDICKQSDPHRTCVNTNGSYECNCENGYLPLKNTHFCEDKNECSSNKHNCSLWHTCFNMNGHFECRCKSGYTANPSNSQECIDIDECQSNNPPCDHECINLNGSYRCDCNKGYVRDPNGNAGTCLDINECQWKNGGCDHKCINLQGSYRCECDKGYITDPNRHAGTCLDENECKTNKSNCSRYEVCTNHEGGYSCTCRDGFGRHPVTRACVDATVLRPKSCSDIKQMEIGQDDGEYPLYVHPKCSVISIYCADMRESKPRSYVTLHSSNNFASACAGIRPGCPRKRKSSRRKVRTVFTTFQRIRVYLPKMYVNKTDTRFATGNASLPYGTATSCGNWSVPVQNAVFHIDLQGTGLRVHRGVSWKGMTNRTEDARVIVSRGRWQVDGHCAGNCNHCQPDGRLKLKPSVCTRTRMYGR